MPARPGALYATDLAYPARGRRYCDGDIHLTSRLRADFDPALCHPLDAAALMDGFDAVVVRNSGPYSATAKPTTPPAPGPPPTSLGLLDEPTRDAFVAAITASLHRSLDTTPPAYR